MSQIILPEVVYPQTGSAEIVTLFDQADGNQPVSAWDDFDEAIRSNLR